MRRIQTKSLPEYCIKLTPASYARIMAIAAESHRPVDDLLASAIAVFATAIRDLSIMHPPKLKPWPKPKSSPSTIPTIAGTVQRTVRKITKGKRT